MVTVDVVEVDPKTADSWISQFLYEHQRPISANHVQFLAGEMERGVFKQGTTIEIAKFGDLETLIDGQHRLRAVMRSNIPQKFVVIRRDAASLEDIALDYTRTDQNKRRTVSQNYKVLELDTELGMSQSWINSLGAAVAFINNDFKTVAQYKLHSDDRLALMRKYADACQMYIEATAGKPKDLRSAIERAASVALGLVTFRYSMDIYGLEKVDKFWNGTALDDGLRADDPRKVANRHLIRVSMSGGGYSKQGDIVTPAYSARYLANCFNAWVEDRELQHTNVRDTIKPISINGVPQIIR